MKKFTVSLFGHRRVDDIYRVDNALLPLFNELMTEHAYIEFLIGRNGEFDEYVASLIRRVRKAERNEWCGITLVLPYTVSDIEYYEGYYDSVLIPSELRREHPKHAITARNRYMVEISDLVIVYAEHAGGAYDAMKYAQRMGKSVVKI